MLENQRKPEVYQDRTTHDRFLPVAVAAATSNRSTTIAPVAERWIRTDAGRRTWRTWQNLEGRGVSAVADPASLGDRPSLAHRLQAPWRVTLFLLVPPPLFIASEPFSPFPCSPRRIGASMHTSRPHLPLLPLLLLLFLPLLLRRLPLLVLPSRTRPYTGIRADTVADRRYSKKLNLLHRRARLFLFFPALPLRSILLYRLGEPSTLSLPFHLSSS